MQMAPINKQGFTLVEVMIAVSILALVILSYVGLLHSGMQNMGEAISRSTESRITQNMLREVQQADWETLDETFATKESRTCYFDDQGIPVKAGHISHIYTARIYLDQAKIKVILPGDTKGKVERSPHLRTAIVRVTNRPGKAGERLLEDESSRRNFREYSGTVVNLGKSESTSPED